MLTDALTSIIIAVVGVPGVILGAALIEIPRFGRKWAMVFSSASMGASLFLYATITTPAASVGFNAMEYFCMSYRSRFAFFSLPSANALFSLYQFNQLSMPFSMAGHLRRSPPLSVAQPAVSRLSGVDFLLSSHPLSQHVSREVPACCTSPVEAYSCAR